MEHRDAQHESHNARLQMMLGSMEQLMPPLPELLKFVCNVPLLSPTNEPILVPVAVLRFTHHTVNGDFAFGEDHENRQESIFK